MNYYFPSIIDSVKLPEKRLPSAWMTVDSGENAVRLLLRSYRLREGSSVAVPFYVCDSLKQAVLKEGLSIFYLDLKNDGTFWADYNSLEKERLAVVILVHLYGFLHPDSKKIMEFCQSNNIPLIHDAAQSYGINEESLFYSSGLVYSFGPGKSSTAAGGAIVKGLDKDFYERNCRTASDISQRSRRAKLFLRSRVYGYKFSLMDRIQQKIAYRSKANDGVYKMVELQEQAAAVAIEMIRTRGEERKKRYSMIKEAVEANPALNIAYDDGNGLYFKVVLQVRDNEKLKNYLKAHDVPFFSLFPELLLDKEKQEEYPVFMKNAASFIELSTEASLPLEEMHRVAKLLKEYK